MSVDLDEIRGVLSSLDNQDVLTTNEKDCYRILTEVVDFFTDHVEHDPYRSLRGPETPLDFSLGHKSFSVSNRVAGQVVDLIADTFGWYTLAGDPIGTVRIRLLRTDLEKMLEAL